MRTCMSWTSESLVCPSQVLTFAVCALRLGCLLSVLEGRYEREEEGREGGRDSFIPRPGTRLEGERDGWMNGWKIFAIHFEMYTRSYLHAVSMLPTHRSNSLLVWVLISYDGNHSVFKERELKFRRQYAACSYSSAMDFSSKKIGSFVVCNCTQLYIFLSK